MKMEWLTAMKGCVCTLLAGCLEGRHETAMEAEMISVIDPSTFEVATTHFLLCLPVTAGSGKAHGSGGDIPSACVRIWGVPIRPYNNDFCC